MKTNVPLFSLILLLLAIPSPGQETKPYQATVGKDANGKLEVTLENKLFLVRYAAGEGDQEKQKWAIRDLVIKNADEDKVGMYIDACDDRGVLTEAVVTRDDPTVKTVRLRFDGGNVQDVSIFADSPWLKIDYITYGGNIVDIGLPKGVEGKHYVHGADKWHRTYLFHPESYYSRRPGDNGGQNVKEADPADGGPLSYKGYFIMGVCHQDGGGFGRIMPVRAVNAINLLQNSGFEMFTNLGGDKEPYTAYLFVINGGTGAVESLGKRIVDEVIRVEDGIGGPRPGDVYREFTSATWFGEANPDATHKRARPYAELSHAPQELIIDNLTGAVRAEVSVQYWGGHIGTADQKFSVNDSGWFQIPQPIGTPTEPQCYYRTVVGDNTVEIPVQLLKEGKNQLAFGCGRQILRYDWGWGHYWIYSFTVRVYYGSDKAHATGKVILPSSDQIIGESPVIKAEVKPAEAAIKQVDFIALYDDFDWEGNGLFRQWHYQYKDAVIARHLGTATKPPYSITWDTTWVPDQDRPMSIMARIVEDDGSMSMTPAVENVKFKRTGRSVRMYRACEMPEAFGVRVGARKSCAINLNDDPARAKVATLILSTWSAAHADEIGINGTKMVDRIGVADNYSCDLIPVPLNLLRKGRNEFYVFSNTERHSAEVNWPGPVLLLEFSEAAGHESGPAVSPVPEAQTRPVTSVPDVPKR